MPSHIPRTLDLLKTEGWTVAKVEQWVSYLHRLAARDLERLKAITRHAAAGVQVRTADVRWLCNHLQRTQEANGVRKDLWGFGDLFGFKRCEHVDGSHFRIVQVCARSGLSTHRKKIAACPEAQLWVQAGGEIELIGWGKGKVEPHHKRLVWIPKREMVT